MRMSLLFGVKTVVDSNRGRLETCRGKSAMPLLEADKGMALFPQPQLLQGYANADLQKAKSGKVESRDPACLRLTKSRLRRLLACMAPAGAHTAQVESHPIDPR